MVETVEINENETTSEAPVVETTPTTQAKPEWLPEKFNSPEEMAKAYGELENKLGQPNPETPEPVKEDTKSDMEIADKAVESAGLDMGTLQQEFDTTGTLAETSYEALAKAGIPKDYVDQFIAGQNAVKASQEGEVKGLVGGDEGYSEMTSWAGQNMTAEEKTAYNSQVNSGDLETVKLAVLGLKARYEQANGSEPSLVKGKGTTPQADAYNSWAEVTVAMSDPRYSKDPAYQSLVKSKIAASKL